MEPGPEGRALRLRPGSQDQEAGQLGSGHQVQDSRIKSIRTHLLREGKKNGEFFVHPASQARPEGQPARPEVQPARPEAQSASQPSLRLQAWLAGPQALLDGPEGGTDKRTNERMDGRKISPFYRTLSPIGAAALPPP